MAAIGRIDQPRVAELLDEERDPLVAVAAVGIAGMGQKPDHRLVELDALGALRSVGGDRAFRSLDGDRAGAVPRQKESDQRLEGEQLVGLGLAAEQRAAGYFGERSLARDLVQRHSAEPVLAVLFGVHRGADGGAEKADEPGQVLGREPRDELALQGAPGERHRNCCQHGVCIRTAFETLQPANEHRLCAARFQARQHQLGPGVRPIGG